MAALRRSRRESGLGGRLWQAVSFMLLLLGLWVGGLVWFIGALPDDVEDTTAPTDAIVVLTGGSDRLAAGFDLLDRGLAEKLFVSGVYRGTDVTALLRMARQDPNEIECCVVLGYAADDTVGNARETARWMGENGYRSLRLVTADYHMPRSLHVFRSAMPETAIVPHPVFPETVMRDRWWSWPGTTWLLAREYTKYLATVIRSWVVPFDGFGQGPDRPESDRPESDRPESDRPESDRPGPDSR